MFRKSLDEGRAGENCGVLLRGIERDAVERGQVLSAPGSINPHTEFEAEIYVLSKEEGGRHTPSSVITDHNSILEQPMLLVLVCCLKVLRW